MSFLFLFGFATVKRKLGKNPTVASKQGFNLLSPPKRFLRRNGGGRLKGNWFPRKKEKEKGNQFLREGSTGG